jgi:glycerate dehydrogenase
VWCFFEKEDAGMRIVVGDAATLGADLDLSPLEALGALTVYAGTAPHEMRAHFDGADVAVINKLRICRETLGDAPTLRLVCVCATGYDNVDLDYCRAHGIGVCNVKGYSTDSVAQLTLAMALSLATNLTSFRTHVASGAYTAGGVANCLVPVFHELRGKTWGVVGYGNIGAQVAQVAQALGCRVLAYARTQKQGVENASLDELLAESDVISVHLPLTPQTRELIGAAEIAKMKKGVIFINVARGAVTDEAALADAVRDGKLGGLGVDVYTTEPFGEEHPFFAIRDRENVCLTPHMAWGAAEARARCLDEVAQNIRAYVLHERRSRVD